MSSLLLFLATGRVLPRDECKDTQSGQQGGMKLPFNSEVDGRVERRDDVQRHRGADELQAAAARQAQRRHWTLALAKEVPYHDLR
jgi:hypothetical protein